MSYYHFDPKTYEIIEFELSDEKFKHLKTVFPTKLAAIKCKEKTIRDKIEVFQEAINNLQEKREYYTHEIDEDMYKIGCVIPADNYRNSKYEHCFDSDVTYHAAKDGIESMKHICRKSDIPPDATHIVEYHK